MSNVIALEAITPRTRDPEPEGLPVDSRYSPSFVDLGTLQLRACGLSAKWRLLGYAPYPQEYKDDVRRMIQSDVRHVVDVRFDELQGRVGFTARDDYGEYDYNFAMKSSWFASKD